jgi:acylphosphatase
LKKLNKIKPAIKIKEIDNRDDGSVDISFVINNPALNLFKKVHKLKNMHKKDLYVRIGEIILKTLSDEQ